MELKKTKSKGDKKKNHTKPPKKGKTKSLDEFLATWSDEEESDGNANDENPNDNMKHSSNNQKLTNENSESEEESENDSEDQEDSDGEHNGQATKQKEYLAGLKDKDPEFYNFLKENDEELLNFDESSDEDEPENEDKIHHLPDSLEVPSDESDFEADEDDLEQTKGSTKSLAINSKQIDKWTEELKQKPDAKIISEVIRAFRDAIQSIHGQEESAEKNNVKEGTKPVKHKKKKKAKESKENNKYAFGSDGVAFNSIARLCLAELSTAINKVLKIDGSASDQVKDPRKSKTWPKLNKYLKIYTLDLIKLLKSGGGGEPGSVISAVLKHVHGLIPYYAVLPKSSKTLIKSLITLWSSHKEESVRVLAFMCLLRLARRAKKSNGINSEADLDTENTGSLLESIMKQMYMAYIRNVKFTSPNTWPVINFMRRSLAEIFNLDTELSYRYAFVYIRQLTIHLRNAMIQQGNSGSSNSKGNPNSQDEKPTKNNKKEMKNSKDSKGSSQIVCNWQFIHSAHLWVQLLSDSQSEVLEPLIYPLVQLITGAIRLVYTQIAYYPFRFHLCRRLIQLSAATGKFVPILPYYLDILSGYNFGKKAAKVSMKPLDFSCIVKCSKSQLTENGFKDAVVNEIYGGILECLHYSSSKIAFPELMVPALVQLRSFIKRCRIANYTKKIKQLLDKTNENVQFVLSKRRKVTDFGVRDLEKIRIWESALRQQGPPLSKFYESWSKVKEEETLKVMSDQVKLDDYNFIPKINNKKSKDKPIEEFKGIFGDDDDSDQVSNLIEITSRATVKVVPI